LRLIDRGHAADPRVPRSLAAHAIGRARPLFAGAAYGALVSGAAGRIGQGGDARELLELLPSEPPVDLDGEAIAAALFAGIAAAAGTPAERWIELWPRCADLVHAFLSALESRSGLSGLSREVA